MAGLLLGRGWYYNISEMRKTLYIIPVIVLLALATGCRQVQKPSSNKGTRPQRQEQKVRVKELKDRIDVLLIQMQSNKYKVREAAEEEIRHLLFEDMKTVDMLISYLNEQVDKTQDIEVRARLERITKQHLHIGSLCDECELIIIAQWTGGGCWDLIDGAGNLTAHGHMLSFEVAFALKGESEKEVSLPESDTTIVNGQERTHTFFSLPESDVSTYLIFIREKKNVRAEGGIEILAATEDNPLAAYALSKLVGSSLEILVKALSDADSEVRKAAVWALGVTGEGAVEYLIEALKDEDDMVHWAAFEKLMKITKQDFGWSHAKWKTWYEKNKDK